MFSQATIRNRRKKEIEEIEEQLHKKSSAIKTKIAGVRAQLVKSLQRLAKLSGRQALTENYISQWFYWGRLQFFVAVMQAGKIRQKIKGTNNKYS